MKLRVKLVASFGFVVIGMLIALSAIAYLTFSETIQKDRFRYFESKTQGVNDVLNTYIGRELDVVSHAYEPFFSEKGYHAPDPSLIEQIRSHFAKHPVIAAVGVYGNGGETLLAGYGSIDADVISSLVKFHDRKKNISFSVNREMYVAVPFGAEQRISTGSFAIIKLNRDQLKSFIERQYIPDAYLMVTFANQTLFTYRYGTDKFLKEIDVNAAENSFINNAGELDSRYLKFVPQDTDSGLRLTYVVPRVVLYNDIVTLKNRIITALVLLGWISVWLVLIIAYRIVQPIAKLSQASKDIISFSYGEPLDFKRSNDEVGVLASNFEIMRQKIRELISIDPLTNVHNRRYLMHALEMAVEKAVRTGEDLSCVMIDIDHFKQINDRYGHLGGDQVLACLGGLLQANVRMYDIVARFGGEEFALVLPGVPLTEAFETAERIRLIVDGAAVEFKDHQIHFTISAGVSTIKELPVKTSDSLVDCADSALYKAKGAGRNKTARYTPDML